MSLEVLVLAAGILNERVGFDNNDADMVPTQDRKTRDIKKYTRQLPPHSYTDGAVLDKGRGVLLKGR